MPKNDPKDRPPPAQPAGHTRPPYRLCGPDGTRLVAADGLAVAIFGAALRPDRTNLANARFFLAAATSHARLVATLAALADRVEAITNDQLELLRSSGYPVPDLVEAETQARLALDLAKGE